MALTSPPSAHPPTCQPASQPAHVRLRRRQSHGRPRAARGRRPCGRRVGLGGCSLRLTRNFLTSSSMLLAPSLFYGRKNVKLSRFRHPTLRDMTTMKSDGWTKLVSELSVSYNCIFVVIAAITYRVVQKKGTVLLSNSLAWPAVAGCSRAETFSQLSSISFAQPCT